MLGSRVSRCNASATGRLYLPSWGLYKHSSRVSLSSTTIYKQKHRKMSDYLPEEVIYKQKHRKMSDYLPEKVLINILRYLPAKSLLRFTCVCKSWYSIITSPNFITTHLNRTNHDYNKNHLLLLGYYPDGPVEQRYSLHFDFGDTFDSYEELDFPLKSLDNYCNVLGICNGLICLVGFFSGYIIMWNPSIRKSVTLPRPISMTNEIGFGYDSQTDDYKVVRMLPFRVGKDSKQVELYKLSTGYWETITATIDPSYHVFYDSNAFTNGAVHWYGYKKGGDGVIVSFDMSDEVFHVIKLPLEDEVCRGWRPTHEYMSITLVSGECLSFCNIDMYHEDRLSMWVMKDYGVVESWTKLCTIDLTGGLTHAIGFRRKGEILLSTREGRFVLYDPKTHQFKLLGVNGYIFQSKLLGHCDSEPSFHKLDVYDHIFNMDAYVESLVLLGSANRNPRLVMQARKNRRSQK